MERSAIMFAVILIVAFSLRALPYLDVADRSLLFLGADTYYHMWRVERTIDTYPCVPRFDPFHGYPGGSWDFLPPLFTFAVATFAMVLGMGSPDVGTVRLAGAIFPLLMGLSAVLLTYIVGKRLFGRETGLHAALALATMTAAVEGTLLGRPDHHCAIQFLSLAIMLSLSRIRPHGRSAAGVAGLLLGIAILTWLGSILFAGIVVVAFIVHAVRSQSEDRSGQDMLLQGAGVLLVATAVILPTFGSGRGTFSFQYVSPFHPTVTFAGALALVATWSLRALFRHERRTSAAAGIALCVIGTIALTAFLPDSLTSGLLGGVSYVAADGEYASVFADEARPLIKLDGIRGLIPMVSLFGAALPLGIIGVALAGRTRDGFGAFTLAVWCVVLIILTLYQRRFSNELAAPLAIAAGLAATTARRWLHLAPGSRGHALLLLVLVAPGAFFSGQIRGGIPSSDMLELSEWVRRATPPVLVAPEPRDTGGYGIMCPWAMGFHVLYLAHRPPLADNAFCGGTEPHCGLNRSIHFFFSLTEMEATGIMDHLQGRYVITIERGPYDPLTLRRISFLGRDSAEFYEIVEKDDGSRVARLMPAFLSLTNTRLHDYDGSAMAGTDIRAMERFRLVHETPTTALTLGARELKRFKVFEYVRGALLTGHTDPGADVTAEVAVRTNQGRTFIYRTTTVSDESGRFSLRVPYSTEAVPYETAPLTSYTVGTETISTHVRVSEDDVRSGAEVAVTWE